MFSIWRRGQLGTQRRCADEHRIARAVQTSSQLLPLCLLTKSNPPPPNRAQLQSPRDAYPANWLQLHPHLHHPMSHGCSSSQAEHISWLHPQESLSGKGAAGGGGRGLSPCQAQPAFALSHFSARKPIPSQSHSPKCLQRRAVRLTGRGLAVLLLPPFEAFLPTLPLL